MKKVLVSLMAMSVLSVGAAAYAGSLSDALQNAADRVDKKEQAIDNAQKEAAKRQEARQKAYEKQKKENQQALEKRKKEIQKKQEQAKKDAEARQKARDKELQKKKDAWNTLIGK